MSIEGGWWTFTYEDEYETCPECGSILLESKDEIKCSNCEYKK